MPARSSILVAAIAIAGIVAIACGSIASDDDTPAANDPTATDEPSLSDMPQGLDPLITAISFWDTDFSIHSVDLSEFRAGGPAKGGIPAIDNPKSAPISEAESYIVDREPVIAVEINGEARAYPLGILTRHEIANDVLGGVPIAVTFCPLCNSAIVFEREVDGVLYDFGVSGVLRNSDLVMYDRQTESWWQQFVGEAIVGELTGTLLPVVASQVVSWADYKAAFPNGTALSNDTGFAIDYGFNPYIDYDSDENPFAFRGEIDPRLSPIERVVAVELGDSAIAYPFSLLQELRIVHDTVNGEAIVVFHKFGTASALDDVVIGESRDVGATGVFRPRAGGQDLTFRVEGDAIVDEQTGSEWSILGRATNGPLAGERLPAVPHGDHFWFAWAAFHPETDVFEG